VGSQQQSEETIQARFEAWIERHPDIYEEFKRIATTLLESQHRHRYGAKAIAEFIRFERILSGQDEEDPFKFNNIYTSRIARKLMNEDTRFIGFFETRELRSE
jgi:hypothetical protein